MFCWSHDSLTFAEEVLAGIFWYYEYCEHFLSLSHLFTHAASYLYPSFQGLMSDNDTVRLGLDFQRMLRINHMLYIAARSVISPEPLVYVCKVFKATVRLPTAEGWRGVTAQAISLSSDLVIIYLHSPLC